jgi:ATP-dependent Clp protease ATP-binding subunit ClpA
MPTETELPLSPQLKRIMRLAAIEAESQQASGVEPLHLLIAMQMESSNPGAAIFQQAGISIDDLRQANFIKEPKA